MKRSESSNDSRIALPKRKQPVEGEHRHPPSMFSCSCSNQYGSGTMAKDSTVKDKASEVMALRHAMHCGIFSIK